LPLKDDTVVIEKLQQLAEKKPNEGQDKFYSRIRNEGIIWNYKRIRRVYKMLGMNKRRRIKKRIVGRIKMPLVIPLSINDTWSMDFMHDVLMNGRKFRTLNIIDDFNREALTVEAYFSIGANRVVTILDRIIREKGKPKIIRVDNGPEFISSVLADWCHDKGIVLRFIQPGKPNQNSYIERFNRSYRQDVLDIHLFENLDQVRYYTDEFIEDYNLHRPHESLNSLSPINYKLQKS
jgi:putative transposase